MESEESHCFKIKGAEYTCEIQCEECKNRETVGEGEKEAIGFGLYLIDLGILDRGYRIQKLFEEYKNKGK